MPLMKIDMIKGRQQEEIEEILKISYRVMLEAFDAPIGDRYQIVSQHEPFEMNISDTGLGFERSKNILVFNLLTRPRTTEQKTTFYENLVEALNSKLGIRREDIMINLVVNDDEDWSFAFGKAQFLTGEL